MEIMTMCEEFMLPICVPMTFSHLGAGIPGYPQWADMSSWKDNSRATFRRTERRGKRREGGRGG